VVFWSVSEDKIYSGQFEDIEHLGEIRKYKISTFKPFSMNTDVLEA